MKTPKLHPSKIHAKRRVIHRKQAIARRRQLWRFMVRQGRIPANP